MTSQYTRSDPRRSRPFVQQQALALSRSNQVTVVAPEFARLRDALKEGCAGQVEASGPVCRPRCWYVPGVWWLLYLITTFWCSRWIDWDTVDIVHGHWSIPSGFAAVLLARWYGKPFVLTEHAGQFETLVGHPARRRAVKWAMLQAERIIVVSRALQDAIQEEGLTGRFEVVPNIVDPEVFFPLEEGGNRTEGSLHLLWVGSFDSHLRKGVPELLEAVALACNQSETELDLTLVGDGAARQEMEVLARQLGIEDICRFAGALPHYEIRGLMQACDALVLSSRSESFGVVLIEAMACGKPVVATACGGPEEIVSPEVGILVEPGDAQALADGILQLEAAYDSFNPARIAAYARSHFEPGRVAAMLEEIYAGVIRGPRAGPGN